MTDIVRVDAGSNIVKVVTEGPQGPPGEPGPDATEAIEEHAERTDVHGLPALRDDVDAADEAAQAATALAEAAQGAAIAAQGTADLAVTDAAAAQSTADHAVTDAEDARSAADAAQATANAAIPATEIGVSVAPILDGIVPPEYISPVFLAERHIIPDETAMVELDAGPGDFAYLTDSDPPGALYVLLAEPASELSNWASIGHPVSMAEVIGLAAALAGKSPLVHTHDVGAINPPGTNGAAVVLRNGSNAAVWSTITNNHVNSGAAIAESKLDLATDAAAGTGSRRTIGTGPLQAAAGNHGHAIAAITGLQGQLDQKADSLDVADELAALTWSEWQEAFGCYLRAKEGTGEMEVRGELTGVGQTTGWETLIDFSAAPFSPATTRHYTALFHLPDPADETQDIWMPAAVRVTTDGTIDLFGGDGNLFPDLGTVYLDGITWEIGS